MLGFRACSCQVLLVFSAASATCSMPEPPWLKRSLTSGTFPSQVSWVKEGFRMAQLMLNAGANDLGGTLMNLGFKQALSLRAWGR